MAYILAVNADILSSSGGPCKCESENFCRDDPVYLSCKADVHRAYIVATAAASVIASGLMGLFANMPLGLAPGLGANAYFATVVGEAGSGTVPYSQALAVVWLEGWIFVALAVFGVRQWLARILPNSIKLSTGAGIGLYLAFIGLGPGGLNIVGLSYTNIVGFAGCLPEYQDENGVCLSHVLQSPKMWVGIFLGGVVIAFLILYRVRGAMIIGILLVSISSWPRGSSVTQFPHTPLGDENWDFFKHVATWRSINPLGPQNIDWQGYDTGHAWLALITFLYIDLLDTTGTLYAMASHAGLVDVRTGDFEGSSTAYISDALSICTGSLLGCSPCTAFIESASGIAEGGRTGITALVVALLFFLSLFFAPIFASLPSWATGSVLVIVGSMMMSSVAEINWGYLGDALPAFLTIIGIPFFYNIAYGLIAGIIAYMILNIVPWLVIKITRGKVVPEGWYTDREPWGMAPPAPYMDLSTKKLNKFQRWATSSFLFPTWLKKLIAGNWYFWRLTDAEIADHLEGRRISEMHRKIREARRADELERMRHYPQPPRNVEEELPVSVMGGAEKFEEL
ncbi:purine nucleobase transmembrane transporter [Malassezia pachydermatis]|uniref:Transmembrane transporter n=1 Tax=Malassezia pachydermatis TaxID=77020 RepID=A0A0M9VMW3_9BASI|nr:transmembrane transporter [Malassezia pachydermatis]KOS12455.1 transmembrane transporter [Malassezia pachydermatis]